MGLFSGRSVDVTCPHCRGTIKAMVGRTMTLPVKRAGAVTWFTVCTFCKSDVILYEETEV